MALRLRLPVLPGPPRFEITYDVKRSSLQLLHFDFQYLVDFRRDGRQFFGVVYNFRVLTQFLEPFQPLPLHVRHFDAPAGHTLLMRRVTKGWRSTMWA
jgi:hypothetical protein